MTRILKGSFPEFPAEAIVEYLRPWTPERVAARLERGDDILVAAYAAGALVGVVSGTAPEAGVGTVIWLLVDASWRGRKVGTSLYHAACEAYRFLGAHKIKLTAPSEEARRFYEGCGMRVEGFHPNHWFGMTFSSLGADL